MGLRRRLQQRREERDRAEALRAEAFEAAIIGRGIEDSRHMYLRGAQSFQIRRLVEDLFDAPDVVSSIEILKNFGTTAQGFYEEALLKEQWEAADVDQREARLLKDIRYANKLDLGEYGEDKRMLVLHALIIRAKVFVFAWAFDAVYSSDYSVRLSRDPSTFGQDEPEAS